VCVGLSVISCGGWVISFRSVTCSVFCIGLKCYLLVFGNLVHYISFMYEVFVI
jgi:hypothetical protein